MKKASGLLLAAALLIVSACEEQASGPYLEITGGGFIFNYRIGEAFYGFVARPLRTIPEGTEIVAAFEDPAGGQPLIIRQQAKPNLIQYSFRTPGVKKVEKSKPYKVSINLIDLETGKSFSTIERSFSSSIDQKDLPSKPLTTGPGYHPYQEN